MTFPVPNEESAAIPEVLSADGSTALREFLTRAQADGAARVTVVYAPTVTHHHAAPRLPVASAASGRSWTGPMHPGIDVNLSGYGGTYAPPQNPAPLPAVAERRELAPLVLLVSTWTGLGGLFVTILTGSPFAIASVFLALVVSAVAFAVNDRNGRTPRN